MLSRTTPIAGGGPSPAALAALVFLLALQSLGCGGPPPPDLLVVTLDTTRVDHLSCYGYKRQTTPNLDRFAESAVRYTRAWSTSSCTIPAHASLFTGLFPAAHGAQFDAHAAPLRAGIRARVLDERFDTMAELLAARGYRTAAFVGGPWLERSFGLMQGFEHVDDHFEKGRAERSAQELTDRSIAWLREHSADQPVFVFVNYFDPHLPYTPRAGFDKYPNASRPVPPRWWQKALTGKWRPPPRLLAALIDRYDGEIRYMDHHLGRLLAAFRERPGADRSLVIIASDHGESFGEEGFYLHNGSLGEETVRIALLIHYPNGRNAGSTSDVTIQLVDLLPLVAAETGTELHGIVQGVAPGERSRAYLDLRRNSFRVRSFGARYDHDWEAVIEWPYKMVLADRRAPRLLRLGKGVTEAEAEAGGGTRLEDWLELLARHRARVGTVEAPDAVVDPEMAERLRALGYLD